MLAIWKDIKTGIAYNTTCERIDTVKHDDGIHLVLTPYDFDEQVTRPVFIDTYELLAIVENEK